MRRCAPFSGMAWLATVSSEDRHLLLALPKYLHEHSRVLIEIPIRIVVIILVALVTRAILHRMINRAVRPIHVGEVPRILRPFKERVENSALLESTGLLSERRTLRAATIGSVLKSGVSFMVLVIAFLLVLSELSVDLAPFIAGSSIVGVALGFGAQNIVKDFLSGMFMMLEDQYGVGDVIDFEKAAGTVEAVVLDVPIAANADIAAASAAMLAVAQQLHAEQAWTDAFLGEPEVQGVERLTREETVIRLVARVRPVEQWRVARELRRRIRERLDRLDIEAHLPAEPPTP